MWWYLEVDVIEYVQSLQKQSTSPPEVKSNDGCSTGTNPWARLSPWPTFLFISITFYNSPLWQEFSPFFFFFEDWQMKFQEIKPLPEVTKLGGGRALSLTQIC